MASGARMDRGGFWIGVEGSFGAVVSADGSGYTAVPVMEGPIIVDGGVEILATDFAQSRARRTKACAGPQKLGTVTIKTPCKGMSAAATAAVAAADDYLDLILANRFGADTPVTGTTIAAVTSSTLDPTLSGGGAPEMDEQDLVPVLATALATRSQWRRLGILTTNDYALDQNWDTDPQAADVIYGSKNYRGDGEDGSSLGIVVEIDGKFTTLGGARVTALSLTSPAGGIAFFEVTFTFDSRSINDTAKSALPDLGLSTQEPIKGLLSPVMFNGSTLGNIAEVKIDWNPVTTPRADRTQTNGRSDIVGLREDPLVTVKGSYATQFETDHDAQTGGTLSCQFGAGPLANSAINTCCFFAEGATVETESPSDNSGLADHDVAFRVHDAGFFTGTTDAHYWTFARG